MTVPALDLEAPTFGFNDVHNLAICFDIQQIVGSVVPALFWSEHLFFLDFGLFGTFVHEIW